LATALAGPGVGIATGVVTSAVNTLRNPTFWPFVVVQIIVALYAWVAARAGLFRSFRTAVPAGLGLGVIASLTSTPISYFVFGCTTTGGIALTTALGRALGLPPVGACFFGSFVSDFGDKAVTFALVTSVLRANVTALSPKSDTKLPKKQAPTGGRPSARPRAVVSAMPPVVVQPNTK